MEWILDYQSGEVADFGEVVIESNHDFDCDDKMAKILEMKYAPEDEFGHPYRVVGLVKKPNTVVFERTDSPSIGKSYNHFVGLTLSESQFAFVADWLNEKISAVKAAEEKDGKIKKLLVENGLDDETIRQRREQLLAVNGLL